MQLSSEPWSWSQGDEMDASGSAAVAPVGAVVAVGAGVAAVVAPAVGAAVESTVGSLSPQTFRPGSFVASAQAGRALALQRDWNVAVHSAGATPEDAFRIMPYML